MLVWLALQTCRVATEIIYFQQQHTWTCNFAASRSRLWRKRTRLWNSWTRNFSGSRKTPWRKRAAEKRESSRKSPCRETAAGRAGSYRTGTCLESSSPRSTHLCVTALPACPVHSGECSRAVKKTEGRERVVKGGSVRVPVTQRYLYVGMQ